MSRLIRLVIVTIIASTGLHAQTVIVKGRVVDGSNDTPLPFANIFIDRTTIGTAADGEGYFELKGVSEGRVELLFSFVGYRLGKRIVNLIADENNIGIVKLEPSEVQLSEIEVKASRDKTWEKQLAKFEKIFLGVDEMADGCKILNPWVLDFSTKEKGMQLTATAREPLEIENSSLGYKLSFFLSGFWKNAQGYLIEGKVMFQPKEGNDKTTRELWAANRRKAYVGSTQHLFKSIIDQRISGENFKLYTERPGLENATARSLSFQESFNAALMNYDTSGIVRKISNKSQYEISLKGRIEIHNYNERSTPRVYRDMGFRVSWINIQGEKVVVDSLGFPINPSVVIVSGDMSDQRVSYMLPQDFVVETKSAAMELPSYLISGVVLDAKTKKAIEGVEVFIDNSVQSAPTDGNGRFTFQDGPHGFISVVAYKEGYELYHSAMRIQSGRSNDLKLSMLAEGKKEAGRVRMTLADDISTGYRIITYQAPTPGARKFTRFEQLPSVDLQQRIDWEQKRKGFYDGSIRHWFASLAGGTSKAEGFSIQSEGEEVDARTLLSETSKDELYRIKLDRPIEVRYGDQVSTIKSDGFIDISGDGLVLNDLKIDVEGPIGINRLPIDYLPIAGDVEAAYSELVKRYYERVYLHTDKPYYYQGEPMWFSAYLNYYDQSMRDSLSRVLYVELISPTKEVLIERMVKIDSGFAHGDFILPDTLKRGDYFLRAYTNLQRNFGDDNLFVRHVPILGITDKVDPQAAVHEPKESGDIKIVTDRDKYKTREKISVKLDLGKEQGRSLAARVSISVTDVGQVVPMKLASIDKSFPIERDAIDMPKAMNHGIETGITLRGVYFDGGGSPAKAKLDLMQWKSTNIALVETKEDGRFEVTGFDFYDSARIFYSKAEASNEIEKGSILIEKRDKLTSPNYMTSQTIPLIETDFPQRIFSMYEIPLDARVLGEVVIRENKAGAQSQYKSSYGRPDFVLNESNINKAYPNILYSLYRLIPNGTVQRGGGLSVTNQGSMLLTINDVPVGGDPSETLSLIDPNVVDRVEVTTRVNVLYGAQGYFGVIAVYLKSGVKTVEQVPIEAKLVKVKGYDTSRPFTMPQYPNNDGVADYRSTLFWQPDVVLDSETGSAEISFYSADLETTYRVVVEGVTSENIPVRSEHFITVSNN